MSTEPMDKELEALRVCVAALASLATEGDRRRVMVYLNERHRDRNAWPSSQRPETVGRGINRA